MTLPFTTNNEEQGLMFKLLTLANPKATKSIDYGYLTGVLHLAPSTLSGHNVCPKASPGCSAACLNNSGRGRMPIAQRARLRRTLLYFNDREAFHTHLKSDIYTLQNEAEKQGLKTAIRINGTSDLPILATLMAQSFQNVQFYDYTKIKQHALRHIYEPMTGPAKNLHLTFSRSETNEADCLEVLQNGGNVSVVFAKTEDQIPKTYLGYEVIDGDVHDLRFLDPKNVVVGLKPKGPLAMKDTSGFVVRNVLNS